MDKTEKYIPKLNSENYTLAAKEAILSENFEMNLEIQANCILHMAITQDNNLLVTSASTCRLKVWNIQQRRHEFTFEGFSDHVLALAITHKTKYVATGSLDKNIRLYSFETRKLEKILYSHSSMVSCIAFSKDDNFLISGCKENSEFMDTTIKNKEIITWNLNNSTQENTCIAHQQAIDSIVTAYNPNYFVSAGGYSENYKIYIWDIIKQTKEAFNEIINNKTVLAITKNDENLISGSNDHRIRIWDLYNRVLLYTIENLIDDIGSIQVSLDSKYILIGGICSERIKLIDYTSKKLATVIDSSDFIRSYIITNDSKYIIYSINSQNKTHINVYNIETKLEEIFYPTTICTAILMHLSDNYKWLFIVNSLYMIKMFNLYKKKTSKFLIGHTNEIICLTSKRNMLISGSNDGTIKIWDISAKNLIQSISIGKHYNNILGFTIDENLLIVGLQDNIALIDIETKSILKFTDIHNDTSILQKIKTIQFTPDNNYAIYITTSRKMHLIDLSSSAITELFKEDHILYSKVFVGNKYIVTDIRESHANMSKIAIWNIFKNTWKYEICKDFQNIVKFQYFSEQVFIIFTRESALFWNVETNQKEKSIIFECNEVTNAIITLDLMVLVYVCCNCDIIVVNLITGVEEIRLNNYQNIKEIRVIADNQYAIVGFKDNCIRIWDLYEKTQKSFLYVYINKKNVDFQITKNFKYIIFGYQRIAYILKMPAS